MSKLREDISDFDYLYEFYTEIDKYYDKECPNEKARKKLQNILLNSEYPWNSMVDIIRNQKMCMEKYF